MSTARAPSSTLTSFVVASRYVPVYIAIALLIVVAAIWAPATLRGPGLNSIAPFATFLAIAALGQMLVMRDRRDRPQRAGHAHPVRGDDGRDRARVRRAQCGPRRDSLRRSPPSSV
jgi:hypothetical protein